MRKVHVVRIWQIDPDKDIKRVAFLGHHDMAVMMGGNDPKKRFYRKVFDGLIDVDDLESLYSMLQTRSPEGFTGRSLSVSDIVEVRTGNVIKAFYVDNIGFKFVAWDDRGYEEAIA